MADTKISALTATSPALSTHRIPIAISPFGAGDNGYLTPTTLATFANLTAYRLANGGTLTGANTITGTTTNILKYVFDTLGVTQTNGAGHWLANTTAAAAAAQQVSPSMVFEGQGWKTNATAASQSVKVSNYVLPVQGAANPSTAFLWQYSVNAAAYATFMRWDQVGDQLTVPSTLFYNGGLVLRSGSTSGVTIGNAVSGSAVAALTLAHSATITLAAGTSSMLSVLTTFAPTSGTAVFDGAFINPTINQTGGANGQITGVRGAPIITAAVSVTGYDWNPTNPNNISGTHLAFRAVSGNALIGGTSLTTSAILDLQSTTRAFIPPRMTEVQRDAIASPSAGMVVYNTTTNKLNLYTTAWEAITSV